MSDTTTEKKPRKGLRMAGFIGFSVLAFLYFIYATFPYKALIRRSVAKAQRRSRSTPVQINMEEVWPSFFTGMGAKNVTIKKFIPKRGTAEVNIDEISVRIGVFSLLTGTISASIDAEVGGGEVEADVSRSGKKVRAKIRVEDLKLQRLRPSLSAGKNRRKDDPPYPLLKVIAGFPVSGSIKGNADITGNRKDYRKGRGLVMMKISGITVGPGTVKHKLYGEVPVPRVRLGNLRVRVKIRKGAARILEFSAKGKDAEAHLQGFVQLHPKLSRSVFIGKVRFRLAQAFLNRKENKLLKLAMSMAYRAKGRDGYYHYRITWPFSKKPRIRMGRK